MAATRRNRTGDDNTRAKIQTTQLVKRLQSNAMGDLEPELSVGRLKAIEILLRKSLPDLAAVTISGDPNKPVKLVIEWEKDE